MLILARKYIILATNNEVKKSCRVLYIYESSYSEGMIILHPVSVFLAASSSPRVLHGILILVPVC